MAACLDELDQSGIERLLLAVERAHFTCHEGRSAITTMTLYTKISDVPIESVGRCDIVCADCLDVLKVLPANCLDAMICDPPAAISFLNKSWDKDRGGRDAWVAWLTTIMWECLRVLKPGGHGFVWALPRRAHWTGWALESAGFEVRDSLAHLFAQGMPKGDNLKPGHEYWWLVRKPLVERTIEANVQLWGVGRLNVTDCKVPRGELTINRWNDGMKPFGGGAGHAYTTTTTGGHPQNVVVSHDPRCVQVGPVWACVPECACRILDAQSGYTQTKRIEKPSDCGGNTWGGTIQVKRGARGHTDSGGASRFYHNFVGESFYYHKKPAPSEKHSAGENPHDTVKSIGLCKHLVELACPKGGVVLDPFMGSGTTGIACVQAARGFIGIEIDPEYYATAKARLEKALCHP